MDPNVALTMRHEGRPKSDAELRQSVCEELEWDSRVRAASSAIGVDVCDAIVTLTGRVSSCSQRSAAQDAAHRVAGVLDVVNEVHVRPPDDDILSDIEIAHALREAFVRDARLPHEHIHTTVSDGVVTLEGCVPYLSQHDDAGTLARTLRGVREVKNALRVEPPSVPEDALKQAILHALVRHVVHIAKLVSVSIEGTVVTLSGEVDSPAERLAVVDAVRAMPGIAAVEDRIHVR
jgi:osmotically-inducible protein OsmY